MAPRRRACALSSGLTLSWNPEPSGFGRRGLEAHLPRSLRSLEILSNLPASAWAGRGDTAPLAGRGPLLPKSLSHWRTSSRCPAVPAHSSLAFVVVIVGTGLCRPMQVTRHKSQNKKPCHRSGGRVEGNSVSGSYLPASLSSRFPGVFPFDVGANPWREERRRNIWP